MISISRELLLPACLIIGIAGCSPWQTLELETYLAEPEYIKDRGFYGILVTTIFGDTYEGYVLEESDSERLVIEIKAPIPSERPGGHSLSRDDPWRNHRRSGVVISIAKDEVKAIKVWTPIY